jgi:hypothetical protein
MERIMKKYILTLAAFSLLMNVKAEAEVCSDGKSIAEKRGIVKETLKMYQDNLDQFLKEAKITSLPEDMVDARQRMTNGVANIDNPNAGNCNNVEQDPKKVTRCCKAIDDAQALIDEVSKSFVTWRREVETAPQATEAAPTKPLPEPGQSRSSKQKRFAMKLNAPLRFPKEPTAEQKAAVQARAKELAKLRAGQRK